jgi:hypothetical protein
MIIRIDNNTYIQYDEATKVSRTIFKNELEQSIEALSAKPSDDTLLAWAKENYPRKDNEEAVKLQEVLDSLKDATIPEVVKG